MKHYAIVNASGAVENIAIWDGTTVWKPEGESELIPCDGVSVDLGWLYNKASGTFDAPPTTPIAEALTTAITTLQFFERFTDSEQLAIVTATMTNPTVKLWYDKLMALQEVTLADPRLSAGLDSLVAAGLITSERKAEILPQATEGVTAL